MKVKEKSKNFINKYNTFLKYSLVGASSFILEIFTFHIFANIMHIKDFYADVMNNPLIWLYIFTINKIYTFEKKERTNDQLAKYFLIVSLNTFLMPYMLHIMTSNFNIFNLIAKTLVVAFSVLWNYPIYKYFVYNDNVVIPELTKLFETITNFNYKNFFKFTFNKAGNTNIKKTDIKN